MTTSSRGWSRAGTVRVSDPWSLGRLCAVTRDADTGVLSCRGQPARDAGLCVGRYRGPASVRASASLSSAARAPPRRVVRGRLGLVRIAGLDRVDEPDVLLPRVRSAVCRTEPEDPLHVQVHAAEIEDEPTVSADLDDAQVQGRC